MQLPVTGHPLHTRSLTLVVSQQEDGLLRARGDVVDLRKCGFVPMSSGIQPAGTIHQMWIELVVDPATRRIDSVATGQPFVAVERAPSTGGECCRDPAPRLEALAGEVLDGNFTKRLSAVFGGPLGCSHLLTLFQLMASGMPRALDREEAVLAASPARRRPDERLFWRSLFLDGFEAEDGSLELAVQFHDFHGHPDEGIENPLDRFVRQDEVRVFARVETPSLAMADLRAFERIRERATLLTAEWEDRGAVIAELVGKPIIPGLAGRIFKGIEATPENAVLRDALLQLAPGQIQVMAAMADRWFSRASDAEASDSASRDRGPQVASIGGTVDSCYMWRAGGALAKARWDS